MGFWSLLCTAHRLNGLLIKFVRQFLHIQNYMFVLWTGNFEVFVIEMEEERKFKQKDNLTYIKLCKLSRKNGYGL